MLLKFALFANDTNVFMSSTALSVLIKSMNAELVLLSNWFKANKLSLNTKKTSYMIFGGSKCKKNLIYSLVLEGDKLVRNSTTKFLGVTIDDRLNWRPHINKLILKLNRNASVVKIRYKINALTALKLYDSMILSHLS